MRKVRCALMVFATFVCGVAVGRAEPSSSERDGSLMPRRPVAAQTPLTAGDYGDSLAALSNGARLAGGHEPWLSAPDHGPHSGNVVPAAASRAVHTTPMPLPTDKHWQHVVATFDGPTMAARSRPVYRPMHQAFVQPPVYGGLTDSPDGTPYGDLWSYYHNVNDRWWASGDFLHWKVSGYDVPPLVTFSPAGTPPDEAGVLPDAELLFGDETIQERHHQGGRVRLGHWLVDGQFKGLQFEYFGVVARGTPFFAESTAEEGFLARPFIDSTTGEADAALLSGIGVVLDPTAPGQPAVTIDGQVEVTTRSELHSFAATYRHVLLANFENNVRIDYLLGYRFLRFDESLQITDIVVTRDAIPPFFPADTAFRRIDRFATQNDFHGGEIGLLVESHRGPWSIEGYGKVGFGVMQELVDVQGSLAIAPPSFGFEEVPGAGGLLAQPGLNIGRFSSDRFAVMPEGEINLVCQINDWCRARVGYNVMYINRVVRPGDQIDLMLDPETIAPQPVPDPDAEPSVPFRESHAWMHGVSAGLEVRW